MRSVTATQWSWRSDTSWVDFDDQTNLLIETEYLQGSKKVKIDSERFVDLSLKVNLNFI